MSSPAADTEALAAHNRDLEAALREANETLNAIRNGEVDAVVVGGPNGQIVYTLENADRPYRVLVEQMREGAVTLDAAGTILYANQSFAELIGRRSEELVGQPITDFVDAPAKLQRMLIDANLDGASDEISIVLADGALAPSNISVVDMVVERGEARMLCVIVTDLRHNYERARELSEANHLLAAEISDRKKIEQSLAIALDAADMGSWDHDPRTGTTSRSARHDAMLGYAQPQPPRTLDQDLDHYLAEDRDDVVQAFVQALITGRIDIERRIRRVNDGAVRWVQIKGRTFFKDGRPERITGVIVDNTDRRLLDEALRQSQKMEAIGQLTGGIAHDFNNLLMIIGGSLEALARRVRLDDGVQKLLDAARIGVARGAKLNQQLLAFARRQDMREEAVNITDLLPTFEVLLDRAMGEAVRVVIKPATDLWHCRTDPHQLETAILNLAINARDAMNDRGELVLSTANRSVSAAQASQHEATAGDFVVVAVADTGTGMSPHVAARVFEPFFTTKPVGKGTGLGLSQVYGFARQSGGFVEMDSHLGVGTTVSIFLPRTEPPLPSSAKVEPPARVHVAEGAVLLVEDDADVRGATKSMLEEVGYAVVEAPSSEEALAIIENGAAVDLVFTDVIMASGMTGIELARVIKVKRPDLPILLTSGYTAQRRAPAAINGDLPLLRKPYTLAQLVEALADLMTGAPA